MTTQPKADAALRFNFLTYANRSGSTVFARRLAMRAPSLLVIPEFRLPGMLLAYGDASVRRMSTTKLHQLLSLDTQLYESLMLGPQDVWDVAQDNAGAGIRAVLEDIARRYGTSVGNPSTVVLIKGSGALRYPKSIKALFPEARFLDIVRDGRAVVNSMLRTPVLWHDEELMGRNDVYHCAGQWSDFLGHTKRLAAELPFLELRYEHLLTDETELLKRVCSFLDIEFAREPQTSPAFEVSEREQRIHPLLMEELSLDRETAWKNELPRWQGLAIEARIGRSLNRYGYGLHFSNNATRLESLAALARAVAVHVVVTPRWALRRLWALRHRPQYLLVTTRAAVRRDAPS